MCRGTVGGPRRDPKKLGGTSEGPVKTTTTSTSGTEERKTKAKDVKVAAGKNLTGSSQRPKMTTSTPRAVRAVVKTATVVPTTSAETVPVAIKSKAETATVVPTTRTETVPVAKKSKAETAKVVPTTKTETVPAVKLSAEKVPVESIARTENATMATTTTASSAAVPVPTASEVAGTCRAKKSAKKGGASCRALAVVGGLCAAHAYNATGEGTCVATTSAGGPCKRPPALGAHHCPFHIVAAALAAGFDPPQPGCPIGCVLREGIMEKIAPREAPREAPRAHDPYAGSLLRPAATPWHAPMRLPVLAGAVGGIPDYWQHLHNERTDALAAEWMAAEIVLEGTPPAAGFQTGCGATPTAAQLKGEFLLRVVRGGVLLPPALPTLTRLGLAKSTSDTHRRVLLLLARELTKRPDLQRESLAKAILEVLCALQSGRTWRHSTLHRNLCSAQGALKLLPLYADGAPAVLLSLDACWSQAMRAASAFAKEEKPRRPVACTTEQIHEELRLTTDAETRATLVLCWALAARPGCIAQLEMADLLLNADRTISVTFFRGKTVKVRGAFSVHSAVIPEEQWAMLCLWVSARAAHGPNTRWASRKDNGVLAALRKVDKNLEQRSLRRGSLQTMAMARVPNDVLREFSGHTSDATLLRYLNWGLVGKAKQDRMVAAGNALW